MNETILIWDLDEDEEGNVQHIAEHGLTKDEVASAFRDSNHWTTESEFLGSSP